MTDTPIPFPLGGIDDTLAASRQPGGTTPQAKNARAVDAKTGRLRGGQRPGLVKKFPLAVPGGSPVLRIDHLTFDPKKFTYEVLRGANDTTPDVGDVSREWDEDTGTLQDAVNLKTDAIGNLYALSGHTLEKFNTAGKSLWSLAIPVDSKDFTLRPMVIDAEGSVYIGIESGPEQTGATIFKVRQKQVANSNATEPEIHWAWQTDQWVRELKIHNGKLKVAQQDDVAFRAYVVTLSGISGASPIEVSSVRVTYPVLAMVIKEDGASVTGHPPFADRDTSPLNPGTKLALESWTPDDLEDSDTRIWSWFKASDLTDTLVDGEPVTFWEDRSGNGRHLSVGVPKNSGSTADVPTLDLSGSIEGPVVRFDGNQGLFSQPGGGTDAQRDACLSMLPNHGDGAYCVVMTCRPASQKTEGEVEGDTKELIDYRRYVIEQPHHGHYQGSEIDFFDAGPTGAYQSGFLVNSATTGTDPADNDLYCWGKSKSLRGTFAAGYARAYTSSSGYQLSGPAHDLDGYDPGAWTAGTSAFDWPGMPLLRGAGKFGWPMEIQYDDPTATEQGEGLTVFTFMHCGGLDECLEMAGSTGGASTTFTLDDADQLLRYPDGAVSGTWTLWDSTGVTSVSVTSIDVSAGELTLGSSQTFSTKAYLVPPRNLMSRSLFRKSGDPADRWEALPMGYAGVNSLSSPTPADREINNNVEAQQTGLGLPAIHAYIKGFLGEISEIIVLGRRQTNADRVDLGGTKHHLYPTVLTHTMSAGNAHTNDTPADEPFLVAANNLATMEMEKVEGYAAHGAGIGHRLQDPASSFPHPHYPDYGVGAIGAFDLPLRSFIDDTGQAWVGLYRNQGAQILKTTAAGDLQWCLVSATPAGAPGTILSQDINAASYGTALCEAVSGLALDSNGDIYFAGPGQGTVGAFFIGKIEDSETLPLVSTGFYDSTGGAQLEHEVLFPAGVPIPIQVDAFDNVWVPIVPGSTHPTATLDEAYRVFNPDGTYNHSLTTLDDQGGAKFQKCWAIALPPTNPDYEI